MAKRIEQHWDKAKGNEDWANSVHVCGTLSEILKNINDNEYGHVLNLLSFPLSANAVDNQGMQ